MSKPIGFYKKNGKIRPITKKKPKSSYHGQSEDATWKESSVNDVKRTQVSQYYPAKRVDFSVSEPSWKKSSLESLKPSAHPKIIRKSMTKNIAEISEDGQIIYIDKSVAKEDIPAIVEHEKEFWHLRYQHGMSEEEAMKGAVVHEREYVESYGGDWQAYNLRMASTEKAIVEGSNPHKQYLYSTIKRGKVKVTSEKQHRLLEGRGLPHTHVYRGEKGEIIQKRVNVN